MASAPRLILVTDPRYDDEALLRKLGAALSVARADEIAVQLRDKARSGREVLRLATRLCALCKERGARFIVNDRLDIALAVGADGAHLGGGSVSVADARALLGPSVWVSVAAHSMAELAQAAVAGADAALLSPIFASPGKGAPLGVDALREGREITKALSLYALGGVDAANADSCFRAGAAGVAVIRAAFDGEEPAKIVQSLLDAGAE